MGAPIDLVVNYSKLQELAYTNMAHPEISNFRM
jgi:hypothetical protein